MTNEKTDKERIASSLNTRQPIRNAFPQSFYEKEIKESKRAQRGVILAICIGTFLWLILLWVLYSVL